MSVRGVSSEVATERETPANADQEDVNVGEGVEDGSGKGRVEEREAARCADDCG